MRVRISLLIIALSLCARGQNEVKGLPARATPADYQVHAQAGTLTIAAEFTGHSVPTAQGTFNTEDYVAVEAALFGPADAKLKLSIDDFSIRINDKKAPQPSLPFGMVLSSLKDPEWVPPEPPEAKSKTGLSTGGQRGNDPPPSPPKMPLELVRAMGQHVQKAALPEGDRALPQAGLIFFQYRGKTKNIRSIELIYSGPAGKATLTLPSL